MVIGMTYEGGMRMDGRVWVIEDGGWVYVIEDGGLRGANCVLPMRDKLRRHAVH